MSQYQVIARKYRPQTFKEVIGQTAVVSTIKNSIKYKRLAHAYLFSGSRGTGKTTLARLFAKALNCQNLQSDIEPCNRCQFCLEIASARSLDVIEIDGASNRGIDDIRQINETIGYAPSSGKYKVYIIDEVHMLTKEAFNALLKTLEEPPENIKFFFATTEAHKILPTIVSRCQRFELKRISLNDVMLKLATIAKQMERGISNEALYAIANFSDGSLRDAESLLDQLFNYHENEITIEIINHALGFIPQESFFELDSAVEKQNLAFVYDFSCNLFNSGKDILYFLEELLEHYRKILLFKLKKAAPSLAFLPDNIKEQYQISNAIYSQEECLYILDILISAMQNLHKNLSKQVFLEMLFLKIIKCKNRIPIEVLTQKLIQLENKISCDKPVEKAAPAILQKDPVELKEAPFNLNQSPPPMPTLPSAANARNKVFYDNLVAFAKVELNASFKNLP